MGGGSKYECIYLQNRRLLDEIYEETRERGKKDDGQVFTVGTN